MDEVCVHRHNSFANSNKRWETICSSSIPTMHSETRFCLTKLGNTERGYNSEESRRHDAK